MDNGVILVIGILALMLGFTCFHFWRGHIVGFEKGYKKGYEAGKTLREAEDDMPNDDNCDDCCGGCR